jgi:hypothetical protein
MHFSKIRAATKPRCTVEKRSETPEISDLSESWERISGVPEVSDVI